MKKAWLGIAMAAALVVGAISAASAHDGLHFHCSVCGSHDHGSMWHDSDKDGTNDR